MKPIFSELTDVYLRKACTDVKKNPKTLLEINELKLSVKTMCLFVRESPRLTEKVFTALDQIWKAFLECQHNGQ